MISSSSGFYKSSLYIWKFSVHVLLKTSLESFEHCLVTIENEHICLIVGGSVVKNPSAVQELPEMRVQSLGWKDPLGKEMATHSSILA